MKKALALLLTLVMLASLMPITVQARVTIRPLPEPVVVIEEPEVNPAHVVPEWLAPRMLDEWDDGWGHLGTTIETSLFWEGDLFLELHELVSEIIADAETDMEKAFLLHRWVADNMWFDHDWFDYTFEIRMNRLGIPEIISVTPPDRTSGIEFRATGGGQNRHLQMVLDPELQVVGAAQQYASTLEKFLLLAGIPAVRVNMGGWNAPDEYAIVGAFIDNRWVWMDPKQDSPNVYKNGQHLGFNELYGHLRQNAQIRIFDERYNNWFDFEMDEMIALQLFTPIYFGHIPVSYHIIITYLKHGVELIEHMFSYDFGDVFDAPFIFPVHLTRRVWHLAHIG
jgi:hypothetical protein